MEGESEQPTGTSSEEYYEVEKIVDKKVVNGQVLYCLKWAGWPLSANSWAKKEDVDCPDLIAKYEEKQRRRKAAEERARHEPKQEPLFAPGEPTGFDEGLEASAITGVTKIGSEIIYLVKWKNQSQQGILPSSIASEKCPQLVIQFMENNTRRRDRHSN